MSPLGEAIEGLRADLTSLWASRGGPGVAFRPSPVELTLEVAITNAGTASGGIKWWLINAGGEVSRENVSTQTVKLTLQPVVVDGDGNPTDDQVLIDDYE